MMNNDEYLTACWIFLSLASSSSLFFCSSSSWRFTATFFLAFSSATRSTRICMKYIKPYSKNNNRPVCASDLMRMVKMNTLQTVALMWDLKGKVWFPCLATCKSHLILTGCSQVGSRDVRLPCNIKQATMLYNTWSWQLGMWITKLFHSLIISGWYERIIEYSIWADIHKGNHGSSAINHLIPKRTMFHVELLSLI